MAKWPPIDPPSIAWPSLIEQVIAPQLGPDRLARTAADDDDIPLVTGGDYPKLQFLTPEGATEAGGAHAQAWGHPRHHEVVLGLDLDQTELYSRQFK
jgi:hypothetical protein